MSFPETRLRRMRRTESIRRLFDAPWPGPEKFLWPVFVTPRDTGKEPIPAMPGQFRLSIDALKAEAEAVVRQRIGGILIFGVPDDGDKNGEGSGAFAQDGVVPRAVRAVKEEFPDMPVFTDVCLCAYTEHGHCGPLDAHNGVNNDAALPILAQTAACHAASGADGVAPSAMMDGQVSAIRNRLDADGFHDTLLMSYSTKFASSLYGPFREAEKSAPGKGDRRGYQQSYRNCSQAVRESMEDEAEGADLLMVKPALWYLDVLRAIKERSDLPAAVYNVSGEYSMLHAAADRGWGDLDDLVRESLFALERAGADIIISYWSRYYNRFFS